jgi:hypothetical protein
MSVPPIPDWLGQSLFSVLSVVLGFAVAHWFEVRREDRQRVEDRWLRWVEAERATLDELQRVLAEVATGSMHVATIRHAPPATWIKEDQLPLESSWYREGLLATEKLTVLQPRIQDAELQRLVNKVIEAVHRVQTEKVELSELPALFQTVKSPLQDAQQRAGYLYQSLGRTGPEQSK